MSGYAVSARIVRATPRVIQYDRSERGLDWRPGEVGAVVVDGGETILPEVPISFVERCGRIRDRWAQLTFFVTDPESWR